MSEAMTGKIADGRTDLVFEYLAAGHPQTPDLMRWCAYYGDVSAIKHLLAHGASLDALGDNYGLTGASFHGHWQLVQFLVEQGVDVNQPEQETGESALHSALCSEHRLGRNRVLRVLLSSGANPNCATKPGVETGGFMRDVRTKGETPLHRAAAFGDEESIKLLLDAGAQIDAKDMNWDTPLTWASWHLRPASILRLLCYGDYRVREGYAGMEAHLQGTPHV
jgi:ankyrin repeat protein